MSSSSWDTWLKSAEEHLDYAERLLSDGYDKLAYEKAVYSGECALKAVLVKNGKFSRKDWTHDQRSTVKKIRDNSLLDSSLIDELDDLVSNLDGVEGLTWVDLDYGGSHMDCAHIASTRYPVDSYTPYEMLSSGDAKLKVDLARNVLDKVKKALTT